MTPLQQLHEEGDRELLERFASIEHDRWVKWQKYLHSHVYDSSLSMNPHLKVIPTELYNRWEKQIETKYSELSEKEKESDREQVKPYLFYIHQERKKAFKLGQLSGIELSEGCIPEEAPDPHPSEQDSLMHCECGDCIFSSTFNLVREKSLTNLNNLKQKIQHE